MRLLAAAFEGYKILRRCQDKYRMLPTCKSPLGQVTMTVTDPTARKVLLTDRLERTKGGSNTLRRRRAMSVSVGNCKSDVAQLGERLVCNRCESRQTF
jgi:hypothetical protein